MSKRRDLENQLRSLGEIKEIMNAMKSLALMEVHRLNRFLDTQRRVVASMEAAAADFLLFHPEHLPGEEEFHNVRLLIGSERGFCGDFNESLVRALDNQTGSAPDVTVVAVGSKLVDKLAGDTRVTASLVGTSVVEEVGAVLVKLMEALAGLRAPGVSGAPLLLTVLHHDASEEGVRISTLRPFEKSKTQNASFVHAPLLYLDPHAFWTGLAEQYLFAALHELLYSSLMAENQRRMQHMDAAVRRLERTSAELWQRRNILRQEEITEEIEVIMLSVEALA